MPSGAWPAPKLRVRRAPPADWAADVGLDGRLPSAAGRGGVAVVVEDVALPCLLWSCV